ncbi:MAG: ATP-binding protein [Bryobacteraceae bacterium]
MGPSLNSSSWRTRCLNSYHADLPWTQTVVDGALSALAGEPRVQPYIEYMDLRRNQSAEYLEALYRFFQTKYAAVRFSAIVLSDDPAMQFLLRHHGDLFPGVPVVFCGINRLEDYDLSRHPLFTGVAETLDSDATIAVARKLKPRARRLVVVYDNVPVEGAERVDLATLPSRYPDWEVVYLDGREMDFGEILEALREVGQDSIVLLPAFYRDRSGRFYTGEESTRTITQVSPVPVYTLNRNILGFGVLGGKLVDGYTQGLAAGRIAVRVLRGEPPHSIPPERNSPNRFMFDYAELRRWRIDAADLPLDSVIINRSVSAYEQYWAWIWSGAIFLVLQTGVISILLLNILRRKRAEESLRRSERSLAEAQRLAQIGSWEADLRSGRLYWSAETYRIFGIAADLDKLSRESFIQCVHPEDRERVREAVRSAVANRKEYETEHRIFRPDGSVRVVLEKGVLTGDEAGRPARLVGTVQDVTERRLLEEQLRQSRKMEAIGRLAGGIAHDFNNLLTVINGYAEVLLRNPSSAGCPELEAIRKAGGRAAELTNQLLAFSRKQILQPRVLDLNSVIADFEDMVRRLLGADVDLVTDLGQDLKRIRADRVQIEQVILNLSVNARDAMPRGGRLLVTTRNAWLDAPLHAEHTVIPPGEYVWLRVEDEGFGMDRETLSRIFEPFFTTKETGGTGLGLASAYGIVKQSGGYICVESQPGSGSRFDIYLPATDEKPEYPMATDGAEGAGAGAGTVLLAEDDLGVRDLLRDVLELSGYSVMVARDGAEALSLAGSKGSEISIVVSDVLMPGMTGRELADELVRRHPALPIVLMSGFAEDFGSEPIAAGRFSFLQKPFPPEELLRHIQGRLPRQAAPPGQA